MLLLCFYIVMLLSKLEAGGKTKKGGGENVEQVPVKIKGGNYVSKCENYGVFAFCFLVFVCVLLQKHYKNSGFSQFWPLFCFLDAKARVNNWATVGSITGPHGGPFFLRHMRPSY